MSTTEDTNAAPPIDNLSSKIETLERRRDHIKSRLDDTKRSASSSAYDLAEHAALVDAIKLMQWHRTRRGAA